MVKKLLPMLLILLLMPLVCIAESQVLDEVGVFTQDEITQMERLITSIEAEHQVDMVVLCTDDTPYDPSESLWAVRDYTEEFYIQGNYGMGADYSGMLILLDLNNRVMRLTTSGVMTEYINDAREEDILDRAYTELTWNRYGAGVVAALERVQQLMNKGRAEGTFLYDEATGQRLSGIHNALTDAEVLFASVGGIAVAMVIYLSVNASYNLKGSTYSYDENANTSVSLTVDDETFVRQFVKRTPRNTGSSGSHSSGGRSSGGSGIHRTSSGRSFGGGGRRF